MNELIAITESTIGTEAVQTVNARELHAFLGVSKDFSDWTKMQIERARLIEGRDYCTQVVDSPVNHQKGEKSNLHFGRPKIDYHLTIEAAKHIAMMSGTDKGFEVRDYFIECERRAKNPILSMSRADILRMALDSEEKRMALEAKTLALEHQAELDAPKMEGFGHLLEAQGAALNPSYERWLEGQPGLGAALEGMRWWNGLSREQRAYWLRQADSARPSDAWRAFRTAIVRTLEAERAADYDAA